MSTILIRGGTVVDGTGAPGVAADVRIEGDRVVEVGPGLSADGVDRVLDATGCIVAPGFIDIHTHYDAQVFWDPSLTPSSFHGVTTVLMGNCGVGFAPCRPQDRERLVHLMEGVEDLPEIVLTEGLPWTWQSFTDYLDMLGARAYDMDIATQIPHAALRVFVMGERATDRGVASPEDRARMEAFPREGGGRDTMEFRFQPPTGPELWLRSCAERVGAGRIVGITFDITERKLAEEGAWRAANHDALTGLPNRKLFLQRLDEELAAAERTGSGVSLLLIDLDSLRDALASRPA